MPVTPAVVGHKSDAVFCARGATAPVLTVTSIEGTALDKTLAVKVLFPGPKGSLFEYNLALGETIPERKINCDFIACVVRGRVQVIIGGESYTAESRDAWSGAPESSCGVTALEPAVLFEWISPPQIINNGRQFTWGGARACSSHIFTRWRDVDGFMLKRVEGETDFGPQDVDIRHHLKVLIPGPNGSLMWNSDGTGKWALHTHQHHWVVYLVRGRMSEKFGGGLEYVCGPGDIWAAQAGAEHCTEALEDNEIFEFKWPAPMLWEGIIQSWDPK